jgi:hypothetical protein
MTAEETSLPLEEVKKSAADFNPIVKKTAFERLPDEIIEQ